jgi:hypothetical protein
MKETNEPDANENRGVVQMGEQLTRGETPETKPIADAKTLKEDHHVSG